jgi:signal transduction histidine kinase
MNGGCKPCAIRLKNRMFSFPTMDGLLWINPEETQPVLPQGVIYIDEVVVNGKSMSADSLINLSPATSEILLRPAFSAWGNLENIYFEYQLNDTLNWKPVNLEGDPIILFNNLPSGSYTLRIRKLNGFGINNYVYKEIRFQILAPWYKRWWFFVLMGAMLAALFILFLHLRTRQFLINQQRLEKQVAEKTKELQQKNEVLEKNDHIKTRLISIISHDIITPLKFLHVAGKNLLEKRTMMPEALQEEALREITNTSQELRLLSTNILNWIKYQNENRRLVKENFNLHEMVNQVSGVLFSIAKQKNLVLVNDVDKALVIYQYFESLKILIYNLLLNAINFTEEGSITVRAVTAADIITVEVQDEGVGMTPEQVQNIMADQFIISSVNNDNRKGNGLGYLIIKDLLKMMGAQLRISSEKDRGTCVQVDMPIHRD